LGIPFLVILALLPFAPKSPLLLNVVFWLGVGLLIFGIPCCVFEWRRKLISQGLDLKQLPPAVRRRGAWRMTAAGVSSVAAVFCGLAFFPTRYVVWRQATFYPKSRAFEKLVFSGNISGYQIPFWSSNSFGRSGTVAMKIYGKDSAPAVLTFTLPGLVLQNTVNDPGQGPGVNVLTENVLTNWLHDSARLDLSLPAVRTEARQIMELVQPYYDAAPSSWQRFADQANAKLRDFTMHEIRMNFGRGGVDFGLLFVP